MHQSTSILDLLSKWILHQLKFSWFCCCSCERAGGVGKINDSITSLEAPYRIENLGLDLYALYINLGNYFYIYWKTSKFASFLAHNWTFFWSTIWAVHIVWSPYPWFLKADLFRSFHINTQKVNFRFDLGVKKHICVWQVFTWG